MAATPLLWEAVPHRANRHDCFADGASGRWMIRRTGGRSPHYVLRHNGNRVGEFERLTGAKDEAERLEREKVT